MKKPARARASARFVVPFAIVTTGLAVLASLFSWGLPELIRGRIASELTAMGFPEARFTIGSVGWAGATLTDLSLAPDLAVDAIEIDYRDPLSLAAGRLDAVTLRGADWVLPEDGFETSAPALLLARSSSGDGGGPARVRLADARVHLPGLALLADGDLTPGTGDFEVSIRTLDEATRLDASGNASDAHWRIEGPLPATLASEISAITFDRALVARGNGTVHHGRDWTVAGELALATDAAQVPAIHARLEGVRTTIAGTLTIDEGGVLAARTDTRVEIDDGAVPGTRIEGASASGVLRVAREGGALRVRADGPIDVRASVLAAGATRASEIRFESPTVVARADGDVPLLTVEDGAAQAHLRFDGHASIGGVLESPSASVRGAVRVESSENGVRARIPVRLDAASVAVREGDTTLAGAHVMLPLAWDEHGTFSADGRARAESLVWSGLDVGAVQGALDLGDRAVAIDWRGRATETAPYALRARIGRTTTIDVDVPVSEVGEGDAFRRVLVGTAGIDVRGRAGGSIHVTPGAIGLGTATLTLDGASVDDAAGRGAARGVHGTIVLASLRPVVSAAADAVSFTDLRIGGLVETRDGSARIRFDPTGAVTIADARASIGGGHLYAETFRYLPRDPDLALALRFEGIRMDRIAALLAHGSVRATGVLDGHLGLRMHFGDAPAIRLGDGLLVARGPGRLRVSSLPAAAARAIDLDAFASAGWIEQRVLSALADFEYSDLTFDIDELRGEPCLHASITGHGARTPQELDLTIAVEDVQLLVDQSLRFWTASEAVAAHT